MHIKLDAFQVTRLRKPTKKNRIQCNRIRQYVPFQLTIFLLEGITYSPSQVYCHLWIISSILLLVIILWYWIVMYTLYFIVENTSGLNNIVTNSFIKIKREKTSIPVSITRLCNRVSIMLTQSTNW